MRSPRLTLIALAAGIAAAGATSANAQGYGTSYSEAFEARVNNPGDTASLGEFINVAVRVGQYDQALSTTEQHLIAHPRDAKARLIAGRLYSHLGSYELARRQINHALTIGTLTAEETAEAEDLLRRVERALKGYSAWIALTAGLRAEWTDFDDGTDRDDFDPFGQIKASFRQDLKTATRDAIIYSGSFYATERFYDVDLAANAGTQTALSGRASVTYDKGLPNFGIESLRMLLSGYFRGERFSSSTDEVEIGASLRFTARPTVNTFAFVGASYGDLSGSSGIFTDERFRWEAGISQRIGGGVAIGVAVNGTHDYASGNGEIGNSAEVAVSAGGVVYTIPDRLIWTHTLGAAFGERESPDLSVGLGTVVESDYWKLSSEHDFQLSEKQYISLDLIYRDTDYDSATAIDRQSFEMLMSYTHIFN